MKKYFTIIFLLIIGNYNINPAFSNNKKCHIIGSNTIEKLYYSTSSNYSKNHDGSKAIDNDNKSSWISGKKGPHWIEIDFGSKRIMNKIAVRPGKKDNYYTLKYFIIQFMYRDEWFDFSKNYIKENDGWSFFSDSNNEKFLIDLEGVDSSKFRVFIPEDAVLNEHAAIAEIETFIGSYKLKYYDERLSGMFLPIKNGYLPEDDYRYPNSPRKYRGGTHVGVDILYYHNDDSYDPVLLNKKTPVYAAKDGKIIRADWDYKPMSAKEWKNQSKYYKKHPRTFVKRSFGGIQVWIDHEDGIVTTYNHLSKIDDDVKIGSDVEKGQRIGWAGNSGLLGEAEGKDYGIHLHFEIWIDGNFLGKGMKINDIKKYLVWIFSVHQ